MQEPEVGISYAEVYVIFNKSCWVAAGSGGVRHYGKTAFSGMMLSILKSRLNISSNELYFYRLTNIYIYTTSKHRSVLQETYGLMLKLLTCLILVGTVGCHKNLIPDPGNYACGVIVSFRLHDIKAIPIRYAKDIDEYYIITNSDSTKTKTVAVFCDLPDVYKSSGSTISFDGRFSPVNYSDTSGINGQLNKYFSPAQVLHVAINKVN